MLPYHHPQNHQYKTAAHATLSPSLEPAVRATLEPAVRATLSPSV
jgi:hypothetical protein